MCQSADGQWRTGHRSGVRRRVRRGARVLLVALVLAAGTLVAPAQTGEAHTCTPDATVGVSGRLLLPRGSGLVSVSLPSRETRVVPVLPAQGVATGVTQSPDGSLLAVPRFWRPPDHRIGGQDILLVSPDGGAPSQILARGQPGEVLGAPAWLPDGSLVYERRVLSGVEEAVRIERARPGEPGHVLAEQAAWPAVSSDGALLVMVRSAGGERLIVRPVDGGAERVIVDAPQLLTVAFPRFSPDGSWIAFTAAADPAASPAAQVPPSIGRASDTFRLSPGSLVPLLGWPAATLGAQAVRAHGVPWDVWVVRPDGTGLRRVTTFADDDSSAAWSPDGRWLATLSAEAVHVVALEGAENYCISNEGGYGALEWLP